MRSKPSRTPDHITLLIAAIFALAGSQACEGINWPIADLLRAVLLAMAFLIASIALYLYDRTRKT